MIAAQSPGNTGRYSSKIRESAKFEQISPHSAKKLRSLEKALKFENRDARPFLKRRLYIARSVERMIQTNVFGHRHVESYLNRLNRSGCRNNTIRINFSSIFPFISYLKTQHRSCLEAIVRGDISGFIVSCPSLISQCNPS